jgi:ribosome maturation factor RimP
VLAAHGVSLVDVEWLTERAGWTLRLTIEREGPGVPMFGSSGTPLGGVTLEDCVEVSREASALLDVEDFIAQHYNLEVSSPGLDRKLRSAADFARFVGKTVKVKLSRPAPDGQKLLRGKLESAADGLVAVIVDGKRIEAPLADIEEARLVYELETQPKPAVKGARARSSQGKGGNVKEPRGLKRR